MNSYENVNNVRKYSKGKVRVIKSSRMRWAGHVACKEDTRNSGKKFGRKTWREESTRKT